MQRCHIFESSIGNATAKPGHAFQVGKSNGNVVGGQCCRQEMAGLTDQSPILVSMLHASEDTWHHEENKPLILGVKQQRKTC
eukprot:1814502-Amphidinium_carterae.1